jgi:D-alanine-D-alanine ligase
MITTSSGKVITRVVVLYGGWSHETNFTAHPSVTRAYKSFNIEVIPMDIREPRFVELIQNAEPDVVFITNQGAYGEDGKVQGIFDILDIPYIGSGVCASAIGMNKFASKLVFQGLGLKTAKYVLFPFGSEPTYRELVHELGQKLVIKPIMGGGSFGMPSRIVCKDFQ